MKFNRKGNLMLGRVCATILATVAGNAFVFGDITDTTYSTFNGGTITNTEIFDANTTVKDFYIVGTEDLAGTLNIIGGTHTLSGGTLSDFRNKTPGLLIQNGTVTVENAKLTVTEGIFANATPNNKAELILNNGAIVETSDYPVFGSDLGNSGSLIINSGAEFITDQSLYCAGWGVGNIELNKGGKLTVNNNLQIGRDYEVKGSNTYTEGKGNAEGYFTMTGGELNVIGTIIMGMNNKTNSDHVNIAQFTMTGGTTTAHSFAVACNGATRDAEDNSIVIPHNMIQATFNIGGGSETATLTVNHRFAISSGSDGNDFNGPADGTVNVYDNAVVKITPNGSQPISESSTYNDQKSYFQIGEYGNLNVYGGYMSVDGYLDAYNSGAILVDGGKLEFKNTASTLNNSGTITVTDGSLTVEGGLNNAGTIDFNNSSQTLTVGGAYSGSGKINITHNGVGIVQETTTFMTATSGLDTANVEYNGKLYNTMSNATSINVTLDASKNYGVLKLSGEQLTLEEAASAGYATLEGGGTHVAIQITLEGLENNDTATAFASWMNQESSEFGKAEVASDNQILIYSLNQIVNSDIFAWDFSTFNSLYSANVGVRALGMTEVPEPGTWTLLILGALGLFGIRNLRNRKKNV